MDEQFHTTRWTRVMAARGDAPEAKAALSELYEIYYEPVQRFLRHAVGGIGSDGARDLTHSFFEALIGKGGIGKVEPGRSKFRSYLLGAVKHFLADQKKWEMAEKRGGGKVPASVDAEGGLLVETGSATDAYFDREWAMALLGRALKTLADEHEKSGKGKQFELLQPWLNGDVTEVSQAEVARELGISEGAVKVAIHRLRKRLRAVVRGEIAQTVESEDEVAGELGYLIEALG